MHHGSGSGIGRRGWLAWGAAVALLPQLAAGMNRTERLLFGSPIELLLPAAAGSAVRDEVLAGLAALNTHWNAWKPGELDDLNAALRNGRPCVVTPPLATMLAAAGRLEAASQGCFNPAIGRWVGAWGFHADHLQAGRAPDDATIQRWLARPPRMRDLQVRGLMVAGVRRDIQLDLGACAKGFALDWALDRLERLGVHDALLNLGGNLAAMGGVDGRAWSVGVRDPHGPGLVARLNVRAREAVVTSGTYERRRLVDGVWRSHVLDPRLGRPADGLDSVTVVHRDATLADAAATALLVAGPERWASVARCMGVDEALVVDTRGRRRATPRMALRLQA
jgi:thiamine biosynthesis lipoprotein